MFKVGDRVLIKPGSRHYVGTPNNPKDVSGVVFERCPGVVFESGCRTYGYAIWVSWDKGGDNVYAEEDLVFAQEGELYIEDFV